MAEAMSTSQSCARCSQPATRACTACKADLDLPTTYYCSVECQRAHWTEHKAECAIGASRTALFRAAQMARDLFLDFNKQTWAEKVLDVQERGNELRIAIKELPVNIIYVPFPEHLNLSASDDAAVLSHCACTTSLAYMWDVIGVLLSGENLKFEEFFTSVVECPRYTCFTWPSGFSPDNPATGFSHQFWRVSDTKNAYVLDLASSQFGYHEPLALYKDYSQHVKITFSDIHPGGHQKRAFTENPRIRSAEFRLFHAELAFAHSAAIVKTILEWEASKNITMRRLLRMPQPEFDEKSAELVKLCCQAVSVSIHRFSEITNRVKPDTGGSVNFGVLRKKVRAIASSKPST